MAKLKHDTQGFLMGEAVGDLRRTLELWGDIRNDVRAIRVALAGASPDAAPNSTPPLPEKSSVIAQPNANTLPSSVSANQPSYASPAGRLSPQGDSAGRFVGAAGNAQQKEGAAAAEVASRIGRALFELSPQMEEADPAIKAFNEVAQPLMRGYQVLAGSPERRQENWLRRLYGAVTGFRKDETAFNKAANKSLKAIEEKPASEEGGKGGGFLGALLPFLTRLPVIGSLVGGLTSLLPNLAPAGVPGAPSSPRGGGGALGRAGKWARKIPVLGSLLALGMGAAGSAAIEGDETTTREEKNAQQGKNWGGVAGGLSGAMIGGALGSIIPGIGTLIGGVVGSIVGEWVGGSAGEIVGRHFSELTSGIASSWTEVKAVALGTWDWIKSGWQDISGSFDGTLQFVTDAWEGLVDQAKSSFDSISGFFTSIYDGLKEIPILGDALRAAEGVLDSVTQSVKEVGKSTWGYLTEAWDNTKSAVSNAVSTVKETAGAALESTKTTASNVVSKASETVGTAWSGAKETLSNALPKGLKDSIVKQRALATGANYAQGNIGGLDDAHTRALVASTVETESSGGTLNVRNLKEKGYVGRYQAGAAWLADAGLIRGGSKAVNAAMKADGHSSEWDWAVSGGMDRFLKNEGNWNNGLSLEKYMASAEVQDAAFKTNSDQAYRYAVKKGFITENTSQAKAAALLKARHISGLEGMVKVAKGGDSEKDANNTSARKYFNDLVHDKVYIKAFSQAAPATAEAKPVPVATPLPPTSTNATPVTPAPTPIAGMSPIANPPAAPATVSIPVPMAPAALAAPSIGEAPVLQMPIASDSHQRSTTASRDVGPDLSDRRIAHIVTGGYNRMA